MLAYHKIKRDFIIRIVVDILSMHNIYVADFNIYTSSWVLNIIKLCCEFFRNLKIFARFHTLLECFTFFHLFSMTVKVFDLQTCTWSTLKTYGKPPVCVSFFDSIILIHIWYLESLQNSTQETIYCHLWYLSFPGCCIFFFKIKIKNSAC